MIQVCKYQKRAFSFVKSHFMGTGQALATQDVVLKAKTQKVGWVETIIIQKLQIISNKQND